MGITNEYREFKKRVIAEKKNFKKHWISVPILVAIISVSSTIIFYEAKPLFSYIKIGYTIADEYLDNGGFAGLEKSEPEVQKDTTEKPDTVLMEEKDLSNTTSPVSLIKKVAIEEGFTDVNLLLRIAECESSLNPCAKNATSSATGLFQILDMHGLSVEERCNPEIATRWTINKINNGGLNAWNASKHCWNK